MQIDELMISQLIVIVLLFLSEFLSFVTHHSLKDVNGVLQLFLLIMQSFFKKSFSPDIIPKLEACQNQIQNFLPKQENEK